MLYAILQTPYNEPKLFNMKRRFQFILVFLLFAFTSFGQKKLQALNGFKYAYVGMLQYENGRIDIFGLSSYLKQELTKKGFIVLSNENSNWPSEAKSNPCLVGRWLPSNSGGNKAGYIIKNCKDEIVYENNSSALNWTNDYDDNYFRAMKKAFEPISSFKYNFDEHFTTEIIYPQVETINETEDSLKQYFLTNKIDLLEGIYKSYQSDGIGYYKFAIKKYNDKYKAIILESEYKAWKQGEVKAYFEPSSMTGFYSVKWFSGNKTSSETFANMENPALLSVEFKNNKSDEKIQNKFIKMFPTVTNEAINKNQGIKATGSGFFISSNGCIATNAHVINGAKTIWVSISNEIGTFKYSTKVLLSDTKNDVALLQITDEKFKGLSSIPYSVVEKADIGEKVFTIGYPLNDIMGNNYKLSDGIISAKSGIEDDIRFYQISVPLQPGNSGGPLFNSEGNIIGLTTSRLNSKAVGTQIENVNYAIKSSYLLNLYNMLPNSIALQPNSTLATKDLKDQVKILKNFVCLIEIE